MSGPDRRGDGAGGERAADDAALGSLIQDYIRVRWGEPAGPGRSDPAAQGAKADLPDAGLRERVEVLGLDALKLLRIPAGAVPGELRRLEQQSVQEDARALAAAGRHWARSESGGGSRFDDSGTGTQGTSRQPAGRQRQAAPRRPGQSRGSR